LVFGFTDFPAKELCEFWLQDKWLMQLFFYCEAGSY
jgi:hypothetical protein